MPCYVRVRPTIDLLGPYEDVGMLHRALEALEFSVKGNIIYRGSWRVGRITSEGNIETTEPTVFGLLSQQMAVLKATETARRKGYRVQQIPQKDGSIQVTIQR